MKKYDHRAVSSLAMGVFPTLELLTHQRPHVTQIFVHSKGERNGGLAKILEIAKRENISVEVNDGYIQNISQKENCWCVGIFEKYPSVLEKNQNHLVLDRVSDLGNLGTIIRTMVGFNINNLALIRPSADVFDPKVIRASMGAVFQINFSYFDTFTDYQTTFHNNYYPFMTSGQKLLGDFQFQQPASLIFGNEASGLSGEFQKIGSSVRINHNANIDSLNLPMSVGLGLYELFKQP